MPREHALHRPRHGGRQLTALISAVVFFTAPTLMWVFGARPGEIENHKLAGFPSIADGWSFFTDLPAWATDQLVFRAGAIDAADAISRSLFGEPAPFGQGSRDTGPIPGTPQEMPGSERDSRTSDSPGSEVGYQRVIEGEDGWLYYGADVEAKCSPVRPLAETLDRLDRLRKAVESSGRRFVLVIAPDKTTMVPEHLPPSYAGKDCSEPATRTFWDTVDTQPGFVDLRPALDRAAKQLGKPAYYPNDTHWTDEGAVMLTREIAEAIEPGVTRQWQSRGIGWITGTADLPTMLGRTEDKMTIRYVLEPDGKTDRTKPPLLDYDRPVHYTAPSGEGTVDAPTLVVGDSFTAASSRYLPAGFSDLTILGYPRMGEHEQTTLDAFVDAEVVVVQVVERSVASGNLPLVDEGFIDRVAQAMAREPVR